jgi:hypothetical protein
LSGRDGFGALSPSRRACEAGFGAFVEVKCIFSTMSAAEIFSKSSWIETEVTGSDRTWSQYDQTRPVSGRAARGMGAVSSTAVSGQTRGEATRRTGLIGCWACLVSHDRMCLVVKNPLWTLSVLGPDAACNAFDQCFMGVGAVRSPRPVG